MERKSLLPRVWDVPQVFRNRLGHKVGRQRMMASDGHVLLVVHQPPSADQNERQGRFFWRSPDGNWTSSDLGGGPKSILRHLEQYTELLNKYDEQEAQATTADQYFAVLEGLAPLQRAIRNLHQVLQDTRQQVPDDRDILNLRDRGYELERTAELLYSETKNSLDLLVAKRAEDQAKASRRMAVSAHRLNILAAFFFPLVTLSAVFGVNLVHGLERLSPPWPWLILVGIGLTLGALLTLAVRSKDE